MTPLLKIYEKVVNRLYNSENKDRIGKLYGVLSKSNIVVLSFHVEGDHKDLINCFPANVDIYGVLQLGDGSFDKGDIVKKLSEIDVTDTPVYIHFNNDSREIEASFFRNGQLESAKYQVIREQEVLSQFLCLRLQTHLPLHCNSVEREAISEAFLGLRKGITSGSMAFKFTKNEIYLLKNDSESGVVGVSGNPEIRELCDETDLSEGRKKRPQAFSVDVLQVSMLKRATADNGLPGFKNHAPICVFDKKQNQRMKVVIVLDALSFVNRHIKIGHVYEILVESAIRNLRLFESVMRGKKIGQGVSAPQALHFYPDECGHFITRVYLKSDSEASLAKERISIHRTFMLKLDKPLFRRSNAYSFKVDGQNSGPLINPHEGVKNTDNGGKISLVKGKYAYYHYCQDRMEDNGWGCAYRSLQTLASWFLTQGYTDRSVPTFDEIQKCLVDIGDKKADFVGSRQWIGSTEVSFVLNSLLKVTSKILYVSSGEEMASKGPELASHFDYHGSPVMIGGGELAHTILGVDYNSQTGDLKFLILDPHYTGSEDLHTIQSKGWCGWKGVDFWRKDAYYNMCLPQVPVEV